jgi:hypothetical protein
MLQEVLKYDDFLQLSFARRLVNTSGKVRYREVKVLTNPFEWKLYSSVTTTLVAEIGTKCISQER